MTSDDVERMRIRALVVARMNCFKERAQEAADCDDEDGAYGWTMAQNALYGLLLEIDGGLTVQDIRARVK